jgi:hypothetical protein
MTNDSTTFRANIDLSDEGVPKAPQPAYAPKSAASARKKNPSDSFEFRPLPERSSVPAALTIIGILAIGVLTVITSFLLISG